MLEKGFQGYIIGRVRRGRRRGVTFVGEILGIIRFFITPILAFTRGIAIVTPEPHYRLGMCTQACTP
jgi:hypothetical protein